MGRRSRADGTLNIPGDAHERTESVVWDYFLSMGIPSSGRRRTSRRGRKSKRPGHPDTYQTRTGHVPGCKENSRNRPIVLLGHFLVAPRPDDTRMHEHPETQTDTHKEDNQPFFFIKIKIKIYVLKQYVLKQNRNLSLQSFLLLIFYLFGNDKFRTN